MAGMKAQLNNWFAIFVKDNAVMMNWARTPIN